MATSKQYAWYLEGSKIAIVEKDVSFDNDLDSKDYGPGASRQRWESPQSTVEDGLKVKYVYARTYRITDTIKLDTNITAYRSNGGYLEIKDGTSSYTNYGDLSGYNITDGSYIVLVNAGKFNGLHKTITKTTIDGTNNAIKLDTKYRGHSNFTSFQEEVGLYYYVEALEDESFELDLPLYLQKALVYYIKGKLAEDAGELKLREYFMREFKKMIEKYENSRISGLRIVSSGSHAIR